MNKYENIDIVDIDSQERISELFIADIVDNTMTVGVVSDEFTVQYLFDEVMQLDHTSMYYINLTDVNALYLIYVDCNGYVSIVPAENVLFYDEIGKVYMDMDVEQQKDMQGLIDYCVNEDKNVVLFGYDDAEFPEEKEDDAHVLVEITSDHTGFTSHISDDNSYIAYSYYSDRELSDDEIAAMVRDIYF